MFDGLVAGQYVSKNFLDKNALTTTTGGAGFTISIQYQIEEA